MLIPGTHPTVIAENIRHLRNQGHPEAEATKMAYVFAHDADTEDSKSGAVSKHPTDISLPNESGNSDLYDLPNVKTKEVVRDTWDNGKSAVEGTPTGTTLRGPTYKMVNGKRKVINVGKSEK